MIEKVSKARSEALAKKQYSVQHWINDLPWEQANERLESQPTVNIEGLVGGYTGPGGKTILPHRAVAKIDMRLVPDMKAADALAALKAHLAKRNFGDIEVNMTGGYDPTATSKDSALIQAQLAKTKSSESTRCSCRATPVRIPVTSSPANRLSWRLDTSDSATAAARMRRTNITSSNPQTRRSKASMAQRCRSSNIFMSWQSNCHRRSSYLTRTRDASRSRVTYGPTRLQPAGRVGPNAAPMATLLFRYQIAV